MCSLYTLLMNRWKVQLSIGIVYVYVYLALMFVHIIRFHIISKGPIFIKVIKRYSYNKTNDMQ